MLKNKIECTGGLYGQIIYQWKEKCLNFPKSEVVKVEVVTILEN